MAFRLPRGATLVRFPSPDGLALEGRLTPGDRARGVVLCHPHPLYGGSMLTPVILTVEAAFHAAGFTTLAFNFRGVGASEGTHGEGHSEVADVAGALTHLRGALDTSPRLVAVAGYSFGSYVGGRAAAADPGVGFYLGVAPVLLRYDYAFLTKVRGRAALISGARDEYSDIAKLEALAARLPTRPWVRMLDADHYFADALDELTAACREAIAWAAGVTNLPSLR
jgi:alpha/beta superfamily hydrolase